MLSLTQPHPISKVCRSHFKSWFQDIDDDKRQKSYSNSLSVFLLKVYKIAVLDIATYLYNYSILCGVENDWQVSSRLK